MRRLTLYGDSDLGLLRIVTSDIRLLSLVITRQILYLSAPVRSIALNPQRLHLLHPPQYTLQSVINYRERRPIFKVTAESLLRLSHSPLDTSARLPAYRIHHGLPIPPHLHTQEDDS